MKYQGGVPKKSHHGLLYAWTRSAIPREDFLLDNQTRCDGYTLVLCARGLFRLLLEQHGGVQKTATSKSGGKLFHDGEEAFPSLAHGPGDHVFSGSVPCRGYLTSSLRRSKLVEERTTEAKP